MSWRRFDTASLRTAIWTLRAIRRTRRSLSRSPLDALIPVPPAVGEPAIRGINSVLNRRGSTCLVRSLVLQRWHASKGRQLDLVIGVLPPSQGFGAHAWLEGEAPCHSEGFVELLRKQAP